MTVFSRASDRMRADLVGWLCTQEPLKSLVEGRIYPLVMPASETRTSLVYRTVGGQPGLCLDGPSGSSMERMQFLAVGKDPHVTHVLASALAEVLERANAQKIVDPDSGVHGETEFDVFLPEQQSEAFVVSDDGSGQAWSTALREFSVWYGERD